MNSKIKILHVIGQLSIGGIQSVLLDFIKHSDKNRFSYGICEMAELPGGLVGNLDSDIEVYQCPLRGNFSFGDKFFRILREGGYDGIHVQRESISWWVLRYAYKAGLPIRIAHYHSCAVSEIFSKAAAYETLNKIFAPRYANTIVGCSAVSLKHNISKFFLSNCPSEVIYNPLDYFRFANAKKDSILEVRRGLGIDSDKIVVGACGRIDPIKRPLVFVEVAAEVCRIVPNAIFLWVGDGEMRSQMEYLIAESGLLGKVIITGLRNDVPQLLYNMDIFLQLSMWEGFAVSVIEAQSCGLPVISSEADAFFESVCPEMQSLRVKGDDVSSIVNKVVALVGDKGKRDMLGEKGRSFAIGFDIKCFVNKLESLYVDLYEKGRKM